MPGCSGCEERWLIEGCDLRTGRVRSILTPLSFDFETTLNRVGQGSLTLATKEVSVRDIWPDMTSIYISRLTSGTPVVEFAGMPTSFEADDNGATVVGMNEITHYLTRRNLRQRFSFAGVSQNEIARTLVEYARANNGIPLTAIADLSAYARDRTWESWERKKIGEALEEMSDVINGLDWELEHVKNNVGEYTSTMIFRDSVGVDTNIIIASDRDAATYGLDVDAANHATVVDAIGSGEEDKMLIATAIDTSNFYPQFDDAPSWKDVTEPTTLQSHADGYLEDYREPVATPNVTIAGHDFPHSSVTLGDVVDIHVNFGAVTFNGKARVISSSWGVSDGSPDTRTLTVLPITRASQSVLSQHPTDECEDC